MGPKVNSSEGRMGQGLRVLASMFFFLGSHAPGTSMCSQLRSSATLFESLRRTWTPFSDPTPEVSELREHSIPLILTLSNLVSITQE